MTDVLDRVSAANPVTELDAVQRGVQPLAPHGPLASQRRRLRVPLPVIVAAVLAAGGLAIVGLPGDDHHGPAGIGRVDVPVAAARALDPGTSILHIVMRTTQRGPDVVDGSSRSEIWLAPGGKAGRVRTALRDGTVSSDALIKPAGRDPGTLDPISAARTMLRDRALTPAGRVTAGGRALQRFRNNTGEVTWYFDATTLMPVRSVLRPRRGHGRFVAVTVVVRYQRLADNKANRLLLVPRREIPPRPPLPTSPPPHAPTMTTTYGTP